MSERLFLAVNLADPIKDEIKKIQDEIKTQMRRSQITWTWPENFHITLHFLGDVEEVEREHLCEELRAKKYPETFASHVLGVSAFPSKKQPRTIFVDTDLHPNMLGLRKRTADVLVGLGFILDERPWVPHITIGRVRVQSEVLKPEEIKWEKILFQISGFELMRSTLTSNGSIYEIVESFKL